MDVLDCKMKLRQDGIGVIKKQATPITTEEEDMLWDRSLLGDCNPQVLLDTVIWMRGLCFALRGGMELRDLKRQQIKVNEATNGVSCLEYYENVSKNNAGGLNNRKIDPKVVRHYENATNPARCFVRLYKLYIDKCPSEVPGDMFFLKPLVRYTANQWYTAQPIGHNLLGGTVKRICTEAGMIGNYSNHSLRASATTRLFHENVPEQVIMKVTGHRSLDGVHIYKKVCNKQLKDVSNVLQGNTGTIGQEEVDCGKEKTCSSTPSLVPSHSIVMHGCSNVTINL